MQLPVWNWHWEVNVTLSELPSKQPETGLCGMEDSGQFFFFFYLCVFEFNSSSLSNADNTAKPMHTITTFEQYQIIMYQIKLYLYSAFHTVLHKSNTYIYNIHKRNNTISSFPGNNQTNAAFWLKYHLKPTQYYIYIYIYKMLFSFKSQVKKVCLEVAL